jgi:hypothetical protein
LVVDDVACSGREERLLAERRRQVQNVEEAMVREKIGSLLHMQYNPNLALVVS